MKKLFAFLAGGLAVGGATCLLIPYTYSVRGYVAVGGEWCLILCIGVSMAWTMYKCAMVRETRQCEQAASVGEARPANHQEMLGKVVKIVKPRKAKNESDQAA